MALFRNLILIAFSNIILWQVEGIMAIIVSDLISGSQMRNTINLKITKNSTVERLLTVMPQRRPEPEIRPIFMVPNFISL